MPEIKASASPESENLDRSIKFRIRRQTTSTQKKRSLPTDREINTAVYMLRAKQMGLSIAELDQMEEGAVMDMIIESGNDACAEEYCAVADQKMMDRF